MPPDRRRPDAPRVGRRPPSRVDRAIADATRALDRRPVARRRLAVEDLRGLQGRPLADPLGPQGGRLRPDRRGLRRRPAPGARPTSPGRSGPTARSTTGRSAGSTRSTPTPPRRSPCPGSPSPAAARRSRPSSPTSAAGSSTSRSAGRPTTRPSAAWGYAVEPPAKRAGRPRRRRRPLLDPVRRRGPPARRGRGRRPGDPQGPRLRPSDARTSSSGDPAFDDGGFFLSPTDPARNKAGVAEADGRLPLLRLGDRRRPPGPPPVRPPARPPAGRRGPPMARAELLRLDRPRRLRARRARPTATRPIYYYCWSARPRLPLAGHPDLRVGRPEGRLGRRDGRRAAPPPAPRRDLVEPLLRLEGGRPAASPPPSPSGPWPTAGPRSTALEERPGERDATPARSPQQNVRSGPRRADRRAGDRAVNRPVAVGPGTSIGLRPPRRDPCASRPPRASKRCLPLASRSPGRGAVHRPAGRPESRTSGRRRPAPDASRRASSTRSGPRIGRDRRRRGRAGRQDRLAGVGDQGERPAVLDRPIGHGEVIAPEVADQVARRAALGVADRPDGDVGVPAVVGDLPVMGVAADDRRDPPRLDDRPPVVDARAVEVLPDLERVIVLEDHGPLARPRSRRRPRPGASRPGRRDPQRPGLLGVEPEEAEPPERGRAEGRADVRRGSPPASGSPLTSWSPTRAKCGTASRRRRSSKRRNCASSASCTLSPMNWTKSGRIRSLTSSTTRTATRWFSSPALGQVEVAGDDEGHGVVESGSSGPRVRELGTPARRPRGRGRSPDSGRVSGMARREEGQGRPRRRPRGSGSRR